MPSDTFDPGDPSHLWRLFQEAGNEISSPKMLVCPQDTRTAAVDFAATKITPSSFAHPSNRLNALSYFYGLNGREEDPDQFITGDRSLVSGGRDSKPAGEYLTGQVDLAALMSDPANPQLRWGTGLHEGGGNLGFSDGRVEQLTSGKLREAALKAGTSNNILWLPNLPQSTR